MKPIFISYSRDDSDFVNCLRDDLRANGVNVWIDQTGLKPGTRNWEQALRDALRDAHALVLVATPSSRQSNYVQGELEIAEMYKCPVYPIWAAGEEWADCIPLALIKMQYIDARGDAYEAAIPQLVEALGHAPDVSERPETEVALDWEPRNPYKGLRAFREDDAGDFFGREALIGDLVEALRERIDSDRLLAVIGPSGSGKSSVVMAGLLPRLRDGALPGSAEWVYLDPIVPGARPLESLGTTLANALPPKSNAVIRQDLDDPEGRGLHLLARQITRQADQKLLLLIDQFEELFTQRINGDERRQFITLLTTAVSETKGPVTVILTLRADFYDRPMEYPALFDLLQMHQAVPPMSIDDLRDVIEKPAALPDVQVQFEEDLVGDLLFEVRERVGGLPLLQFTLDQLFEQRDNHMLTLAAYREIGGLRGALARHAETTYEGLPTDDHRTLARTLFLRLIEPSATEQDTTRRRADMSELELLDAAQTQMLREVADAFVTARLLTTGEIAGRAKIEVSHEALIREWKLLGEWLNEARDDIIIQQDVSSDAATWIARGQQPDDDLLYRGTVLTERLAWAARNVPSKDEQALLKASVALEERLAEEDRKRREREAEIARQAQQYASQVKRFQQWATILTLMFAQFANQVRRSRRWTIVLATVFGLALFAVVAALIAISYIFNENDALQAEMQAFGIRQEQASTLVSGGVGLVPFGEGLSESEIFATATQIAELNNWEPVVIADDDGVEMVQVPVGCFWMGSVTGDSDELPVHEVCFDEPYWIDRFEMDNAQFERLGGEIATEESWPRPDQPRAYITWDEAQQFCEQRDAQLPSEAMWEYAARGPNSLVYPWGNEFVEDNVVYYANADEPADVGENQRPEGVSWVGAYDLSGNVWEWVADWYDSDYYATFEGEVAVSPQGPEEGDWRVLRGGGFLGYGYLLRAAFRLSDGPGLRPELIGFRCARLSGP